TRRSSLATVSTAAPTANATESPPASNATEDFWRPAKEATSSSPSHSTTGRGSNAMASLIEMRNVTKEYRGVPAVKNVSFTLEKGEIHALLGENGAGKSTLTKMMAGVTPPTAGEMLI